MKKIALFFILSLTALLITCGGASRCETAGGESFLIISDAHLTAQAQDHEAMLEAVIRAAEGKDTVLLLGDNTNNSHEEEHALVLEWVQEIRQETGAEVRVIPGNHDYGTYTGPEEFSTRYKAYGWEQSFSRDAATASYAVMTEKGTCLLMLDTNQFDEASFVRADGGIRGDTLKWLQQVLDALPDGTQVLACGHHPILPAERDGRTPGAYALGQVLRAYGVRLYLCGHDHGFATAEQDGLRQVTVGMPQAYPGWAGIAEKENGGFLWHTVQIYDAQSPALAALRENALTLADNMARGTLSTTPYADDEAAIEWFAEVYMTRASGEMTPEKNAALLADENCRKWREIETRTVVKDWILNLLENCPEDVRQIAVPVSQKQSLQQ